MAASPGPPAASEAPVALLVDLESGQPLHSREAARRFVPASVTKVMTAYLAFELIDQGKLDENQNVVVTEETAKEWSGKGSTMFLEAGDHVRVALLLRGIASVSANDGSIALAIAGAGSVENWVAMMNATARKLGMNDSHFGTPNGWPDEGNTFVTAEDLVKLADAMIERHPQLYRRYFGKPGFTYNGITQPNHDPITGVVPGADGIKTGYTREAGYTFLGSAERGGRRLAMVLAGVEGDRLRARLARDYLEWGFGNFEVRRLFQADEIVTSAKVQNGNYRHIGLVAPGGVSVTFPKGVDPRIDLKVRYRGPIVAPFTSSDTIAELEIAVEGMEPYRIPLKPETDVEVANPLQRVVNGVLGIFG